MKLKFKIFKRIISLILAVLLFINPLVVPVVYAEETAPPQEIVSPEPTPTDPAPTQTESLSVENGDPSPTPAPESTITTGEADSSAETQTEVNTTIDTIPGEITVPEGECAPPEGQTVCEDDIQIANDNTADVENGSDSLANTGENEISGSEGDAVITTGDATASGEIDNKVNTNEVILELSITSTPTPTLLPELITPVPSISPIVLTVENSNEGTVENTANVSASTGENTASDNQGDAQIFTGDALAWANVLNFLNTNIVGSNFEILVMDINGNSQTIDLNQLWKDILEKGTSDDLSLLEGTDPSKLSIYVRNSNEAGLTNEVNVSAASGNNQANNNSSAEITTGDATALANVANLVNTNIVGAKFFFGIINYLISAEGDLILPRPELFMMNSSSVGVGGADFTNQNAAVAANSVTSLADTGGNQSSTAGNNTTVTGHASAVSNSFSLINTNVWGNDWFYLLINNLGDWNGSVFGWQEPSGQSSLGTGSQTLSAGNLAGGSQNSSSEPQVIVENQSTAEVNNTVFVSASTGNNQANNNRQGVSIATGNASAIANLFSLINTNILGGRWFFGVINILGKWSGNLIFAYPDVEVALEKTQPEVQIGQTTSFNVFYKNSGYDTAKDVKVQIQLPDGFIYLGDLSGLPSQIFGQNILWPVGDLKVGQEGSFSVSVMVDPNFDFTQILGFWQKIIRPVMAAEVLNRKEVSVSVRISTTDPESNLHNNSSSTMTIVYQPVAKSVGNESSGDSNGGIDLRQPKLEITSWNNVNDFIYPGDTVSFELTIANTSDVPVYNTIIEQKLYNGTPEGFGTFKFTVGTVEPGEKGTLSFGLKMLEKGLEAGPYRAIAVAYGKAINGNEIFSNEARSDFNIRLKLIPQVEAIVPEEYEGQVLGASSITDNFAKNRNILLYVILFLFSSIWLVEKNRGILRERRLYAEK